MKHLTSKILFLLFLLLYGTIMTKISLRRKNSSGEEEEEEKDKQGYRASVLPRHRHTDSQQP